MARDRRFGSVRRLPSKKWQARYTWEALEHKAPRTFASRDAAEAWLRTKRTELDTGWILTRERRRRSVTFSEYAQGWLEERQDLKPRTRVLYAGQLDRYLLPAFGQLTVNAITTDTVREWWRRMDPDKATARAHAYALLRTILEALPVGVWVLDNDANITYANPTARRISLAAAAWWMTYPVGYLVAAWLRLGATRLVRAAC